MRRQELDKETYNGEDDKKNLSRFQCAGHPGWISSTPVGWVISRKSIICCCWIKSAFSITKAGFVSELYSSEEGRWRSVSVSNTRLIKLLGIFVDCSVVSSPDYFRYLLHNKILSVAGSHEIYSDAGLFGGDSKIPVTHGQLSTCGEYKESSLLSRNVSARCAQSERYITDENLPPRCGGRHGGRKGKTFVLWAAAALRLAIKLRTACCPREGLQAR